MYYDHYTPFSATQRATSDKLNQDRRLRALHWSLSAGFLALLGTVTAQLKVLTPLPAVCFLAGGMVAAFAALQWTKRSR